MVASFVVYLYSLTIQVFSETTVPANIRKRHHKVTWLDYTSTPVVRSIVLYFYDM